MSLLQQVVTALVVLALSSTVGRAQNLPKIEEFYFDADTAAAPFQVVKADGNAAVDALMKQRSLGRKAEEATSQLARIAVAEGRTELGMKLHQEVLAATTPSSGLGRAVRWNYAWDLFASGDVEGALAQWRGVQQASRSKPAWIPPTYALALWTLGQQDEAIQWYAAAVRTEPDLWGRVENLASLLPHWRAQDRDTLAQVHAAWRAAPPSWP